MMNLGFLIVLLAKAACHETATSTHSTRIAVGLPSRNVSTQLGRPEAVNGHTSQDLGLTTTQQHDYQQIEMDVSWAPMQENKLPVKIVNKQPLLVVEWETAKPLEHNREESLTLAMKRETVMSLGPPQAEPLHPHRRQRLADQAEVLTLNSGNAEHIKTPAQDPRALQTGRTSI